MDEYTQSGASVNNSLLFVGTRTRKTMKTPTPCPFGSYRRSIYFTGFSKMQSPLEKQTRTSPRCERGEVFTPVKIVETMLDTLDRQYKIHHGCSIFSVSTLRWFDPAAGQGQFMQSVLSRLMIGLSNQFTTEYDCRFHILQNMLYQSEINIENIAILRAWFDREDGCSCHIYHGDTLTMDMMSVWGFDVFNHPFDVVLGNPPYNQGGIRSCKTTPTKTASVTLWPQFVEKTLHTWLRTDGGYLLYLTPLSWLKRTHCLHPIMLQQEIAYIELWDNAYSKEIFLADIPVSWYVLRKTCTPTQTQTVHVVSKLKRLRLVSSDIAVKIKIGESIPLAFHSILFQLRSWIVANRLQIDIRQACIKGVGDQIPLSSLGKNYKLSDGWCVDSWTIRDGVCVRHSGGGLHKHPDAGMPKLIIANKTSFRGAWVEDGRLGLCGYDKFYIVGDHLEVIQKLLGFRLFRWVAELTKYKMQFLNKEAFCWIPDVRRLGITRAEDLDEESLYVKIGIQTGESINRLV